MPTLPLDILIVITEFSGNPFKGVKCKGATPPEVAFEPLCMNEAPSCVTIRSKPLVDDESLGPTVSSPVEFTQRLPDVCIPPFTSSVCAGALQLTPMDENTPCKELTLVRFVKFPKLLTYPAVPKPCMLDIKEKVLTYPESPSPLTVDTLVLLIKEFSCAVLT
jgi:hypothetical protein